MKPNSLKFIIEENQVDYFAWWTVCRDFTTSAELKKYLGKPYKNQIFYFEKGNGHWATDLHEWHLAGQKLVNRISRGVFNFKALANDHKHYGQKVSGLCKVIENSVLKRKSNEQISQWLKRLFGDYLKLNALGFVPVVSDLEHNLLSNKLKEILQNHGVTEGSIQISLNILMTSDKPTLTYYEYADLLKLLVKYPQPNKLAASKEFAGHVKTYAWVNFGYTGPAWTAKDFLRRAKKIKKDNASVANALKHHRKFLSEIVKKRKLLEKRLRLTRAEKQIFETARTFSYLKSYRVDVRHYFCFITALVFKELAKRMSMPPVWFRYASEEEILSILAGKKPVVRQVTDRKNFYAEIHEGNKFFSPSKKQLAKILKTSLIVEKIEKTDQVFGQAAFLGKISGRVKIISGPKDIFKVKKGDILVAVYTDPNLLPAMEKAGAFVTDQGGITSHAAIVAREMKKPCVIGTKIATKVFKDGDLVEVDANKGLVRKI